MHQKRTKQYSFEKYTRVPSVKTVTVTDDRRMVCKDTVQGKHFDNQKIFDRIMSNMDTTGEAGAVSWNTQNCAFGNF